MNCLKHRHFGRANAVKSPALAARFGISERSIRDIVNALRCAGHPICSDEFGYYYAKTEAELAMTIRQLNNRISKMALARNGLVRAMEKYTDNGQTRFPF